MRLLNVNGKEVYKNVAKHIIDWDKKSRSELQSKVKAFLRPHWEKYVVYEEFPVYGSRMKVDFVNASKRIAIEVQGEQHNEFVELFHQNSVGFWKSIQRDKTKAIWLESNNFKFVELIEGDLPKLTPQYIVEKFKVYIV